MSIIYVDPIYEGEAHDALRKESRYADRDLAMRSAMQFINTLVQSRDRRRAEASEGAALGAYNQATQHPDMAPQIGGQLAEQAQNYQAAPSFTEHPLGWLGSKLGGGQTQGVDPAIAGKYIPAIQGIPAAMAKQTRDTVEAQDLEATRESRIAKNYAEANAASEVDPELKGYTAFRNDVNKLSDQLGRITTQRTAIRRAIDKNDFSEMGTLALMSEDRTIAQRLIAAGAIPDPAAKKMAYDEIYSTLDLQGKAISEQIGATESITRPMLGRMTDRANKVDAAYWGRQGLGPRGIGPQTPPDGAPSEEAPRQPRDFQEEAGQTYAIPKSGAEKAKAQAAPKGGTYKNGIAIPDDEAEASSIDEFHRLAASVPENLRSRANAIYTDKNSNWGAKLWKLKRLLEPASDE